jgi:glycosyltransferase involved in cell wall biosynthesis
VVRGVVSRVYKGEEIMSLSVIIPVFNYSPQETIQSILKTPELKELIIVDDCSTDPETVNFLNNLRLDPKLNINLIKVFLPKHSWTNNAWNVGVEHATQDYIAILNSDIILPEDWATTLIPHLNNYTIVCPSLPGSPLLPIIKEIDSKMIQGCCFMFKKEDDFLFPAPPTLKHWFFDRLLADRANAVNRVLISPTVIVTHKHSSSSPTKSLEYWKIVLDDAYQYEKITGKDESRIKEIIWQNIESLQRYSS